MANCALECKNSDIAQVAAFFLEGLALPLVGILGITGNILAIIVLRLDCFVFLEYWFFPDVDYGRSRTSDRLAHLILLYNLCIICILSSVAIQTFVKN